MRHYYPFSPRPRHQLKLWRRQEVSVGLASSAGHTLSFPGLSVWPVPFRLKHYPVLSVAYALEKYGGRRYLPHNVARGWHDWRPTLAERAARLPARDLELPRAVELRETRGDDDLDASRPFGCHRWMEQWARAPVALA
jgi:hypothetical protein